MYFSAICAAVPRILTSGPLDSKFRANGFWGLRPRPRPRRFCCPCLIGFCATLISGSCRDFVPAREFLVCPDLLSPSSLFTHHSGRAEGVTLACGRQHAISLQPC